MEISKAVLEDVSSIVQFMEQIFGSYPKAEELYVKWIGDNEYLISVAKDNSELCAVAVSRVKDRIDVQKYKLYGEKVMNFMRDQRVGWFVSLAVSPQYRRQSVGKKLALLHKDWLISQGSSVLVGSSWGSGSSDNSRHLFEKAGFQKLGESSEFMTQQSREQGHQCSVCRGECVCVATFFGFSVQK